MSLRERRGAARSAGVAAVLASCMVPSVARADEPEPAGTASPPRMATSPAEVVPTAAPTNATPTFGIGATTGEFVGLPYRAAMLDGGVRLERRYVRWIADAELELGRTERGLSLYRGAGVGGLENAGRVRVGIGARLSYTMVMRATRDSPFISAVFGDIGGFGLGAQAWLALDIVRTDSLTVGVAGRGSADVYNGGTATRAGALLEVAF